MARPWRLRHKLVLGLALVVASVALLLGGALFGLTSDADAMRATDRKMYEMQMVTQLRDAIHEIASPGRGKMAPPGGSRLDWEREQLLANAKTAKYGLDRYREVLAQNPHPDDVQDEQRLVEKLDHSFAILEEAVAQATASGVVTDSNRLIDDEKVAAAYATLNQRSTDLFNFLVWDVRESFEKAKANHRRSLVIAGFATAAAVVLVLTLLYYFRVWVFSPIRAIQAGVQRVHGGDFGHPIRLGSQDELEELANEFNAMTVRLRDIYGDLARQVNERTRQLVRSERMVSVGFLAAGVAHEINNPLASIAFCAEALERRLHDLLARTPGGDAEVIQKYLRMMQDESQRCKQITQKLLDFSRSGGKREPADLTQLVQDVVEVAECLPTARNKRITFHPAGHVTAPVSVPDVKGVVLNMIVNALDSMEEGGQLAVSLADRGDVAELSFADSGCGMTPDVLENIFEPFYTRNRTGNGTGLGLSISHQIIDQHGGTIAATSPGPGHGSTFTVRLPLRAVGAEPAAPEPAVIPFPGLQTAAA